jgi:hypothetical protein
MELKDITDIVLPILTFFLGLIYSYFDKYRDDRRKLRNMRHILFQELRHNYEQLNEFWPAEGIAEGLRKTRSTYIK